MKIYQLLIDRHGANKQSLKAIEELSELSRAIIRYQLNPLEERNVLEEIADVHIMLEQLKLMCPDWIYEFNKKIEKLEAQYLTT